MKTIPDKCGQYRTTPRRCVFCSIYLRIFVPLLTLSKMNNNHNIRSINQPENYPKADAFIELNSTQELGDHVTCFCVEKKYPLCNVNAECKMLNNYSPPNKRQSHVSKINFEQIINPLDEN